MKIKIKTCVVDMNKRAYSSRKIYEVGKDIDENIANSLLECNFAVEIEEEKKPRKGGKKKDEV